MARYQCPGEGKEQCQQVLQQRASTWVQMSGHPAPRIRRTRQHKRNPTKSTKPKPNQTNPNQMPMEVVELISTKKDKGAQHQQFRN